MIGSLQDLRLFVAAYEERSFTAAASRENATQSGVSQHMRKLEDRFGLKLFTREKGRVAPTPAADAFYRASLDVLRAHDAATKAVKGFAQGLEGEIAVGLMPTMTRCVVGPALARFADAHPNVSIRVLEGYSALLTQQVQAAELDFAIVPGAAGVPGVRSRLFMRTPEILVQAKGGSGRPPGAPIRPDEIGRVRLVVPSRANTRRLSLETYLASGQVGVDRLLELDAMLGTLDLVARPGWAAILPGIMMAAAGDDERYDLNPLASPGLMLDLTLIEPARRRLSEPAAAFLAIVEDEAGRVGARWAEPGVPRQPHPEPLRRPKSPDLA